MFIEKHVIAVLAVFGLGLLGPAFDASARTIDYFEGSFKIPDDMVELPEAEVRKSWPRLEQSNQNRAFEKRDASNKWLIRVVSLVEPSEADNWGNLQEFKAVANFSKEQKLKIFYPASDVSIDVNAQRVTCVMNGNDGLTKMLNTSVPLSNRAVLCLTIIAPVSEYDWLLPKMAEIANSLSAAPQYKLKDVPTASSVLANSEPATNWGGNLVLGALIMIVLFFGPSVLAFRRRMKNRYWVLGISVLMLFLSIALIVSPETGTGGLIFPGLVVWIWAACGKAKPKPVTAAPS